MRRRGGIVIGPIERPKGVRGAARDDAQGAAFGLSGGAPSVAPERLEVRHEIVEPRRGERGDVAVAAGVAGRPSSSAVIARCPIPVTTHAHAPT
ncbi:hypothetical protein BE18_22640 [Sorangium cellulosum]|uniref:Uncharacterized protein n=1 Tax=Sorangium cellulosum TaxID=56 RepID=A0A150RBW7_SORCE|nr:hypothetical protein BE18_22640 [Sorangium cellulosum]